MLVLDRDDGETVMIGDDIIVTVIVSEKGRATLGFTAPKDVLILRGELWVEEEKEIGDDGSDDGGAKTTG